MQSISNIDSSRSHSQLSNNYFHFFPQIAPDAKPCEALAIDAANGVGAIKLTRLRQNLIRSFAY